MSYSKLNQTKSKKGKKKNKKKNKTWYKEKMDTIYSKIIRLRDERCQMCGTTENLQCSHVIPRTNLYLRWDDQNCKALCYRCHLSIWHKDILKSQEWFVSNFPDRAKYLEENREKHKDYTLDDYVEMYDSMKQRLKQMEKNPQ